MKRRLLLLALASPLLLAAWCYANILADPVVRRATLPVAGWPAGTPPIRVALISDIHVQGPDMPPERVARLVAQVNAQKPDLILLAGDFIGDRRLATRDYSAEETVAPLAGLRARLGVWAVLGNHDYWGDVDGIYRGLRRRGIGVLVNQAVRVGPLTLAGANDDHTHQADIPATARAVQALPGPVVLLTHSPDLVPRLPERFGLVLAGHTHCGQVMLPIWGTLASSSRYGDRYRCDVIRENGRTIVVAGGWGASVVPFRLNAPPDWWLLTLGS